MKHLLLHILLIFLLALPFTGCQKHYPVADKLSQAEMNDESPSKENLKELLDEFLQTYYDGSFARMVSEYIRATGLTEAEVDALLEEMKHSSV